MALPSGTRLGPYEVIGPLGAGGMGEVYRARDPRLSREVALKVLPGSVATDPSRLRRFELEARATGALNHPNILAVFDVGSHEGAPYVVSELLEGETLRERLDGGGLPLRKALDLAGQVAMGLAAAHEKGIVHRDLKPENVFITKGGRVKILDFGLAKLSGQREREPAGSESPTQTASGTDAGAVLGTVGYMSPEQVRGLPADARSDIFSFGAVLFEILTRRRAFRGETAAETMTAILREEPPSLEAIDPTLPPALDRVVKRCLEKRPEERFQSATDIAFAIEALSGVTARAPALTEPASRRIARSLGRALVALAIAVLAALAGWWLRQSPPLQYTQLTYRRGALWSARFAPDGQTIVYGAAWEGRPFELFSTRADSPLSRPLGITNADVFSISSAGEMAVVLEPTWQNTLPLGSLAHVPLAGGAPRVMLEDVSGADYAADGKQLAVTRRAQGGWRLEFPVGEVLYETAAYLALPAVSPRADLVAFGEWREPGVATVAIVDLSGRKRELASDLRLQQGPVWVKDGKELWCAVLESGSGSSGLYAMTTSGRKRLVATFPGAMQLVDVFRDGRALVTRAHYRGSVFARPPGSEREDDLSWLDGSNLADISSDGRTVVFSETLLGGGTHYSAYLRKTDGSPAVRLGDGRAYALSPDGKWVLATVSRARLEILLLPTGAGDPREIPSDVVDDFRGASFFPDSRRLVFAGNVRGQGPRLFSADVDGGAPQPIGPAGLELEYPLISPDGRSLAAVGAEGDVLLLPLGEGKPVPVSGAEPGEVPVQWSRDGRSLYVYRPDEIPARVFEVGITGGRRLLREISVADPTGLQGRMTVSMTSDARSYAYSFMRFTSDLFLVEGLR